MNNGRILLAFVVFASCIVLLTSPALAQDDARDGDDGEGGLEGAVENVVEEYGTVGSLAAIVGGALLLTACVEKLISYLTRAALGLKVSLFALAILFTGFEFDDTVLALVLSAGDLEGAALGTALGTSLAIIGVTLALAAILKPFPVDLPTDYVALFAVAPILLTPFVLLGSLTLIHGLVLLGIFVAMFGYLLVREYQRGTYVFRNSDLGKRVQPDGGAIQPASIAEIPEDRFVSGHRASGWIWITLSLVALAGIVLGSILIESGSESAIDGFGIDETVFGATVLTLILTFEDVMLTIEPVRRGVPEIGVGNVIGSVLFSVTGNVGVIMLMSDLTISSSVLVFHLPSVIVITALAAYFLHRGNLKRWHGVLLGSLYVVYWVIAVLVFGGVPISG
ncbi:sodium:calcium antiporter [Natrialbaceae archaeon GCM10025810]|uniref:sodium:calcium antiporter n=1 Tax=Halovalidus salilacus TaxID=3075124 RepID=UPI003618C938